MELAWETDHDDHVSTSVGGVDFGCWVFVVAGGAAVALSYLLKMMTEQAVAAWTAANEGLHVSDFFGASAALALLGMHVKQIKHAAAAAAAANDGWYVP